MPRRGVMPSVMFATTPFKLSPVDSGVVLLINEYPRLTSTTGATPAGDGAICAEAPVAQNKRQSTTLATVFMGSDGRRDLHRRSRLMSPARACKRATSSAPASLIRV